MERVQCQLHVTISAVTLTKIYNCLEDGPLSMPVQDISTALNVLERPALFPGWDPKLYKWRKRAEKHMNASIFGSR